MKKTISAFGSACVLVTVVTFLSGCTASAPDQDAGNFSGPWADSINSTVAEGNEFVKSVLSDSTISDMEHQEALQLVEKCYAAHNATVTYDNYGLETVNSLDGKNDPLELMGTCAQADGGIVRLFDMMRRNPDNLSEEELIASCLVRTGVVDKGFTTKDFLEALTAAKPPWSPEDERVGLCYKDPLGTLSGN